MQLYVFDILERKELLDETDAMRVDVLFMYQNFLRGYTTNRFVMHCYVEFMESLIGKYLTYGVYQYTIPDDTTQNDLQEYVSKLHFSMDDDDMKFSPEISKIDTMQGEMGHMMYYTTAMGEYIAEYFYSEKDIIEVIATLFAPCCINYIIPFKKDATLIAFRQLLLDSLLPLMKDFYDLNSIMKIDPYELSFWYIITYQFLN